jgi:peptide deformylase
MPLQIVHYPHPALRHVSKPLRRVDAELRATIREMFDLMYQARGVGLAANQVDLPYRLFIVNLESDPQQPDLELVFINPTLSKPKGQADQEEGCLSLPGLYADVKRPERVAVHAYNLAGQEVEEELSGMLARVVQHETDHLDGVLFIDRLPPTGRMQLNEALGEFETVFAGQQSRGEVPDDPAIAAHLAELERLRC